MTTYAYQTFYGVEPYDALGVPASDVFGGGAKVTSENLLITLWNVTDVDGSGVPSEGDLLKPFPYTADGKTAIAATAATGVGLAAAFDNTFKSRYSARIFIQDASEDDEFFLGETLLAVLQPPQDFVNDMQRFIRAGKASGNQYGLDFSFLKSSWYSQAWGFSATDDNFVAFAEKGQYGGYGYTPNGASAIPFCMTSGANGTFPSFYSLATFPSTAAMFEALIAGEPFYVPCLFTRTETVDTANVAVFTFSWPYATGRR